MGIGRGVTWAEPLRAHAPCASPTIGLPHAASHCSPASASFEGVGRGATPLTARTGERADAMTAAARVYAVHKSAARLRLAEAFCDADEAEARMRRLGFGWFGAAGNPAAESVHGGCTATRVGARVLWVVERAGLLIGLGGGGQPQGHGHVLRGGVGLATAQRAPHSALRGNPTRGNPMALPWRCFAEGGKAQKDRTCVLDIESFPWLSHADRGSLPQRENASQPLTVHAHTLAVT